MTLFFPGAWHSVSLLWCMPEFCSESPGARLGYGEQQMESHPNLFRVLLGIYIESNYIHWICRIFFCKNLPWSWIYIAISAICFNFWILSLEAKSGYRDCCCKIGIPIRVLPSSGALLEVATAWSVEKSRSDLGLPASWSWWLRNRRGGLKRVESFLQAKNPW